MLKAKTSWPALMLALLAALPMPLWATDCFLRCTSKQSCTVPPLTEKVTAQPTMPAMSCHELGVAADDDVEGMTKSKGRVLVFAAKQAAGSVGESMKRVVGGTSSECVSPSRACREQRDVAMLAGRSGKAFDKLPAEHAPKGSPCAIGLPCGLVLTQAQGWSLRLDEPRAASALLQITGLRMATGSVDLPVRNGRVDVAPGFVRAGATYSYALKTAAGEVIAAGLFSAAAPAIEADVRSAEAAALAAGRTAESARLEALLANDLDWDVMQFTRR